MKLSEIREWFWPLLEPIEIHFIAQIGIDDIKISQSENLESTYEWAKKYYESEEKRRSDVEGKSTIFIGTVGFLLTILLNITKDLVSIQGMQVLFNTIAFSVIIIYFCRVVWFAIKVLERSTYHTMGPNDFITEELDYKKRLTVDLINCATKNSEVVNSKVDNMTMAQAYFKRGICSIGFYVGVLVIVAFCKNFDILLGYFSIVKNASCLNIVVGLMAIVIFVLSIVTYNLHGKLSKISKLQSVKTI